VSTKKKNIKANAMCKVIKNVNMTATWNRLPCIRVEIDLLFRGTYRLNIRATKRPDGGSTQL
jgi:hypothetical protein